MITAASHSHPNPAARSLSEACALDPKAVQALLGDQRRLIVVGAGGWIGRVWLRGLYDALGQKAFNARVRAFGSSARAIDLGDGITADQEPLDRLGTLPPAPSVLFHLAFLTKDKVSAMDEESYIRANRALSYSVLQVLDSIGVDRVFVASSGAARFADDASAKADLRLYGRLKREDEEAFAAWAQRNEARQAVITRIFSVSGPFINKHETYALASFIKDALAGRPVAVTAPMPVYRSYVALRELLSLLLLQLLLEDDQTPQVLRFDTGGLPMELGEAASVVADVLTSTASRATLTSDTANAYTGDHAAYLQFLAGMGLTHQSFADQVRDTATTMPTVSWDHV